MAASSYPITLPARALRQSWYHCIVTLVKAVLRLASAATMWCHDHDVCSLGHILTDITNYSSRSYPSSLTPLQITALNILYSEYMVLWSVPVYDFITREILDMCFWDLWLWMECIYTLYHMCLTYYIYSTSIVLIKTTFSLFKKPNLYLPSPPTLSFFLKAKNKARG